MIHTLSYYLPVRISGGRRIQYYNKKYSKSKSCSQDPSWVNRPRLERIRDNLVQSVVTVSLPLDRGGKSTHTLYSSRSTDTCVYKDSKVKVLLER